MDGKGREGTYNFFSRRLGGRHSEAGHKDVGEAAPCHPAGAAHGVKVASTLTICITCVVYTLHTKLNKERKGKKHKPNKQQICHTCQMPPGLENKFKKEYGAHDIAKCI